jgi:hypothetical protein
MRSAPVRPPPVMRVWPLWPGRLDVEEFEDALLGDKARE